MRKVDSCILGVLGVERSFCPRPTRRPEVPNLRVVVAPEALATQGKDVVVVNSYGFGGANSTIVLRPAPVPLQCCISPDPD